MVTTYRCNEQKYLYLLLNKNLAQVTCCCSTCTVLSIVQLERHLNNQEQISSPQLCIWEPHRLNQLPPVVEHFAEFWGVSSMILDNYCLCLLDVLLWSPGEKIILSDSLVIADSALSEEPMLVRSILVASFY